jgi:hypothetical protein
MWTPSIREFLAKHSTPLVLHVPYSPNVTPLQLLPVSHSEDHPEEEKISRHCKDTVECNLVTAGHSKTGLLNIY